MDIKTVFAALFLLLALFIVGVGLGARERDVQPGADQPGWTQALSGLVDRALRPEDVSEAGPEACRQQLQVGLFILPQGSTCTLVVEASASRIGTRTIMLKLTQGLAARVTLEPRDENLITARNTLRPGDEEPLKLRFMRGGGTLRIACTSGGAAGGCQVQVGE